MRVMMAASRAARLVVVVFMGWFLFVGFFGMGR
jgi:hypothetical protein